MTLPHLHPFHMRRITWSERAQRRQTFLGTGTRHPMESTAYGQKVQVGSHHMLVIYSAFMRARQPFPITAAAHFNSLTSGLVRVSGERRLRRMLIAVVVATSIPPACQDGFRRLWATPQCYARQGYFTIQTALYQMHQGIEPCTSPSTTRRSCLPKAPTGWPALGGSLVDGLDMILHAHHESIGKMTGNLSCAQTLQLMWKRTQK